MPANIPKNIPDDADGARSAASGRTPSIPSTPAVQPAAKKEYIAEHKVGNDDTLSHIALKYYGSAVREKWMVVYEENKALIGDDPGKLRPGLVLKIPKLA